MDYASLIRASFGNPTNDQLLKGSQDAAAMLVKQFGASQVQNVLRNIFGAEVIPQNVPTPAPTPAPAVETISTGDAATDATVNAIVAALKGVANVKVLVAK